MDQFTILSLPKHAPPVPTNLIIIMAAFPLLLQYGCLVRRACYNNNSMGGAQGAIATPMAAKDMLEHTNEIVVCGHHEMPLPACPQ